MLAAFALLCAAAFAQGTAEECGSVEQNCFTSCCNSAGGTFSATGDVGSCEGTSANSEAASAAYTDCVSSTCRPALLSCAAPQSTCATSYTSCFNSCKSGGESTESCDSSCFGPATTCVQGYLANQQSAPTSSLPMPSTSGCCGSGFILAFAFLGAFAFSRM